MTVPFFSVIIPAYNRYYFLKLAVNSVLCQSFKNFELIIIDDGSDDKTRDLVKTINNSRLVYLYQGHKGVSLARNNGVLNSRGKVITFLDSDDRFKPAKLEVTYQYLKKFPQVKIFHTEELWYHKGKLLPQKTHHKKPDSFVFNQALKLCCISISTAAVRKEVFDDVGLFDENLAACEDYDFWLRVTAKYPVKLIPEILTIKEGGHKDQLSKKYPAMDQYRIYAIQKLLETNTLNPEQRKSALEELIHKSKIYIKGAAKRNKIKEVKHYHYLIEKFGKEL